MLRIIKQGSWVSISKFVEKILAFLLVIFASRALHEKGVGEFFFYFSVTSLLIPLMDMGFEKILIQRWGHLSLSDRKELFFRILTLKVVFGGMGYIIALVSSQLILGEKSSFFGISAAFFSVYLEGFGQLLRTPDRLKLNVRFEVIIPLLTRFFCLVLFLFFYPVLTSGVQLCVIYFFSSFLSFLLSFFGLNGLVPKFPKDNRVIQYKEIFHSGIPFSFTNFFVMSSMYIDSVILGHFSISQVGLYNAAYRIVVVLGLFSGGMCHALYPRIAEWYRLNRTLEIQNAIGVVFSGFLLLFGTITIGAILNGRWIIDELYGEGFSEAGLAFVILAPLILLLSLTNLFGQTLEAIGMQKKTMYTCMLSSVFNFVSNLIVIPIYGMYGACLTTLLTESLSLFMLGYHLKRAINFSLYKEIPTPVLLLLVAFGTVFIGIHWLLSVGWTSLFFQFLAVISGLLLLREKVFGDKIQIILNKENY